MKRLAVAGGVSAVLKYRVLRLILLTLIVSFLSGDVLAAEVIRIMPLGDSITRGWYGSAYYWGYRKPLYDLLTNGGYNFDFVGCKVIGSFPDPNHEGRDGWQANELLNGRPSAPTEGKIADWLVADQPDVILLHIGTNDVTWNDINFNDVNEILDVIDEYEIGSGKHVTVILALIINRRIDSPALKRSQTTQFNIDVYNMAMNRIAGGDDIIIVDMENELDYSIGVDMADEVHPNDAGYTKMADVWYDALVDYFNGTVFSISGYVLEADGNTPVEGILIQPDYNDINAVTDANGFYEIMVDYGWTDVASAQKEGFIFEPNSLAYNDVNEDYTEMTYMAELMTFKISGFVLEQNGITPISGVNVSADNGGGYWTGKYGGGSTTTDADGFYEVVVDYNWSGNITTDKYAYAFEPNCRQYENVKQDYISGQDYTGNALGLRISGYVRNGCDKPIKGVLVQADNGGSENTTDLDGYYEVWVDEGWSGAVILSRPNYAFEPNGTSYVNVVDDQPEQNYIADNFYDLNCDGFLDWGDVHVMAENWMLTGPGIPGDFVVDERIDFLDFAMFGLAEDD
ncbi:MAG: hypothetical protein JW749_07295 [Sedimentisphaerales bacterium]|nr:hypothetical protein [Sedimentisphaerales bacterium]